MSPLNKAMTMALLLTNTPSSLTGGITASRSRYAVQFSHTSALAGPIWPKVKLNRLKVIWAVICLE
jgi:hypothetical protein